MNRFHVFALISLTRKRFHVAGVALYNVLLQKFFFGVAIRTHHFQFVQQIDVDPRQVELPGQKTCAGAAGIKVVVVVPLTK